MARLYANENFPLPAVEELRRLGHDVLTSYESGQAGKSVSDKEVLDFAHSEGRALLTLNRKHFVRLHQQQPDHSGIVVCSFDVDFAALAQRIHTALLAHPQMTGQLIRINRPGEAESPTF